MEENIIKLELTQNEVIEVLLALGEKPYNQVYELIGKIRKQGNKRKDLSPVDCTTPVQNTRGTIPNI